MQKTDFLKLVQRYVANVGISGAALRNQGAEGVIKVARDFLAELNLTVLNKTRSSDYPKQLNKWTTKLKKKLPKGAQNWGTARKAINIFMVQAFLNKYLEKEYRLARFRNVLETPLDSQAASKLQKYARQKEMKLPRWPGIRRLNPKTSSCYQEFATKVAKEKKIPRACLDMLLWRAGQY